MSSERGLNVDDRELIQLALRNADPETDEYLVRGAIATFLFKVMPVDGHSHPKELERLNRILCDDFNITQKEADALIGYASCQDTTDPALAELAMMLVEQVPRSELLKLISHLWEMVFADGRLHESEIVFVERVASLLNIPQEEVARAMNP